jgi:DNA recombination protein RmuC
MPLAVQFALAALAGLGLGFALGWLVRSLRPAPADARLENELRQQLAQRDTGLAAAREAAASSSAVRAAAEASRAAAESALAELQRKTADTEAALAAAREQLADTHAARSVFEARLTAAERLLAEQKQLHERALVEARLAQEKALADLRESFKALSADALKQNQPEFLRLANETLAKFQESAKGDLSQRQQAIATLVKPLEEQLKTYQQRLQQAESAQSGTLGELKRQLEALAAQSQSLANETLQFRRVLSSNQARGRWGEETLRRVVEAAGMSAHCDFTEQQATDDKDRIPDMLVHLPGERVVIVDSKVPDLDFLNALEAADASARAAALATHARRLRDAIKSLADRDYPARFPNALDYVVLFLPAESLFSAALEGDPELLVWAAQRRVLLATPASLIALLRSVSVSWQQHAQTENARAIAEAAQELYLRVAKFTEHFARIGDALQKAGGVFNEAVGSYERMVRPSGERLMRLSGDALPKPLAELGLVSEQLRVPVTAAKPGSASDPAASQP